MIKSIVLEFCIISVLAFSCKSKQDTNSNDLIPSDIQVKYENVITFPESSEIFTSLDKTGFTDSLVKRTLGGKITIYDSFDTAKILSKDEIKTAIGSWQDTVVGVNAKKGDTALIIRQFGFDKSELQKLLFTENWW